MYIVTKYFTDLQDGGHPYEAGDIFPREGLEVDEDRLAELASTRNKRGEVLIKEVKDKPKNPTKKTDECTAKAKDGKSSEE